MKVAISETLEALLTEKAKSLGISAQDALRMLAVQWVSDSTQEVPAKAPTGTERYRKGTGRVPEGYRGIPAPAPRRGGDKGEGSSKPSETEKRRKTEARVECPEEIRGSLDTWTLYKSEKRQAYKESGLKQIVKYMVELGPERAAAAVAYSVRNNYAGLVEPNGHASNGSRASPSNRTLGSSEEHRAALAAVGGEVWIAPDYYAKEPT